MSRLTNALNTPYSILPPFTPSLSHPLVEYTTSPTTTLPHPLLHHLTHYYTTSPSTTPPYPLLHCIPLYYTTLPTTTPPYPLLHHTTPSPLCFILQTWPPLQPHLLPVPSRFHKHLSRGRTARSNGHQAHPHHPPCPGRGLFPGSLASNLT